MKKDKEYIIKKCDKCGSEKKLQNRSYESNIKKNDGKYICYLCYTQKNSMFKISDDGLYWIGTTGKGEEFLFNGDAETIEYIKSFIWHINENGYLVNSYNKRLHTLVMQPEKHKQIKHISGNKLDNRRENLLIISNPIDMKQCSKCGKESKVQKRSYKDNLARNDGNYICRSCALRKENTFKISEDGTYWIGITNKGEEFLFNGTNEVIDYIKSCTWHVGNDGYIMNSKNERIHKLVMGIEKGSKVVVNHIGGNTLDNRIEKLSVLTHKENAKERKPSKKSLTKIVGLLQRGNKYCGLVTIQEIGKQIRTQAKNKEDALIDLLIVQKEYGYNHNNNLYYLLNDISEERKQEVLNYVNNHIEEKKLIVRCSNKFKISCDGTYYEVSDTKDRIFKISKDDKHKVENGSWRVRTKSNGKRYVLGEILENGKVKTVQLHRYLLGISGDDKYYDWYIDHKNGDGLDNTRENLVITDALGNALNRPTKGYKKMTGGKYLVDIDLLGENFKQSVNTEQEARNLVEIKRKEAMQNRLEFKNKDELMEYLNGI